MKQVVEQLLTLSEQEWGRYAFSRDPIHRRVSPAMQDQMIEKANQCGREEAQALQRRYGQKDSLYCAERLGLQVLYKDSFGVDHYITFAQFQLPNTITLYTKHISSTQALLTEYNLEALLQAVDIKQVLIAHELFHYIETTQTNLYTQTQVELWKIGPFRYRSGLICLDEIAAMAFAAELLQLQYSPYIFDVLLPWSTNEEQARKLYQEIMQFKHTREN